MVAKLKNSNCNKTKKRYCDKTQHLKMGRKKSWIMTKVKLWQNSNCEEKIKKNQCDKTEIETQLENSNYDKTKKTQIVAKLEIWQI